MTAPHHRLHAADPAARRRRDWRRPALILAVFLLAVVGHLVTTDAGTGFLFSDASSWISQAWTWALAGQREFLLVMRRAVVGLRAGDTWTGAGLLISSAFAYGVVHALGPGHGKVVVTSYALANRETVRRSIAVSFMAAIVQASSAILLVLVGLMLLGQKTRSVLAIEPTLEVVSGALIAALGAFLLFRELRRLWRARRTNSASHSATSDCACDHTHIVEPRQVAGPWSWRAAWLLAFSVGVRPCTGALLLLVFARSQNMLGAGIAGTLAMAVGTAITVSALAALAVGSREFALRFMAPTSPVSACARSTIVLSAGLAVIWFGMSMALTSTPRGPF